MLTLNYQNKWHKDPSSQSDPIFLCITATWQPRHISRLWSCWPSNGMIPAGIAVHMHPAAAAGTATAAFAAAAAAAANSHQARAGCRSRQGDQAPQLRALRLQLAQLHLYPDGRPLRSPAA
jgi:hypothetical protein